MLRAGVLFTLGLLSMVSAVHAVEPDVAAVSAGLRRWQAAQELYWRPRGGVAALFSAESPLAQIKKEDREFLRTRIELYGLARSRVEGAVVVLHDEQLGPFRPVRVDLSGVLGGRINVDGEDYEWDPSRPLRENYESRFRPIWRRRFSIQASILEEMLAWVIPSARASGCTESKAHAATNVGMAALSVGSMCFNPAGALIGGTGIAACQGVYEYCRTGSIKAGLKKTCANLPVVGELNRVRKSLHSRE